MQLIFARSGLSMYRHLSNSLSIFFVSFFFLFFSFVIQHSVFNRGRTLTFVIHLCECDRSLRATNEYVQTTYGFMKKNRHELFSPSQPFFHPSKRIFLRGNSPSLLDRYCAISFSRYRHFRRRHRRRTYKALFLRF